MSQRGCLTRPAARGCAVRATDYHHGNGTQEIFYERDDVVYLSIHADPLCVRDPAAWRFSSVTACAITIFRQDYPYFLGHAAETGAGAGAGYTFNYPLPLGTTYATWGAALEDACGHIARLGVDVLVVSLGMDTYKDDPVGGAAPPFSFHDYYFLAHGDCGADFKLDAADYAAVGRRLAALKLPTLFVMEGGYDLPSLGHNVVQVLAAFEAAAA